MFLCLRSSALHVSAQMCNQHVKYNMSKNQPVPHLVFSISVNDNFILLVTLVKSLGLILPSFLSFSPNYMHLLVNL